MQSTALGRAQTHQLVAAAGIVSLIAAWGWGSSLLAVVGLTGLAGAAYMWSARCGHPLYDAWRTRVASRGPATVSHPAPVRPLGSKPAVQRPATASDMESYIEMLFAQDRYMLLLRPQIADNLVAEARQQAIEALHRHMALVPDGEVWLAQPAFLQGEEQGDSPTHGQVVRVQAAYLDRYPVTNRQYKAFVDAGAYEEMALWDPAVLAGLLDFVDRTGEYGPRYWQHAEYAAGLDEHPVVGISWYEAAAYARWAGKRLPSDPEWVKAGGWPITSSGTVPQQRKYPWGASMDDRRANLWSSGKNNTVPVTEYASGVSVGGIYQLIGNVWEWTASPYGQWHSPDQRVELQDRLRSLRGGAFDSYFDSQASCQFQSGDNPLSRKHNIGFRCALSVCELSPLIFESPVEALTLCESSA